MGYSPSTPPIPTKPAINLILAVKIGRKIRKANFVSVGAIRDQAGWM
jgi:hypothetical protein